MLKSYLQKIMTKNAFHFKTQVEYDDTHIKAAKERHERVNKTTLSGFCGVNNRKTKKTVEQRNQNNNHNDQASLDCSLFQKLQHEQIIDLKKAPPPSILQVAKKPIEG